MNLREDTDSQTGSSSNDHYFKACQIGTQYNPKKLGFLDLPAEIRLMIYPLLFISANRVEDPNGQQFPQTGQYITDPVPSVTVCYESTRHHWPSPRTLIFNPRLTGIWEDRLYPEILSTCRTIHREASPLLELAYYSETAFRFHLQPGLESIPYGDDWGLICAKIFNYEDADWRTQTLSDLFRYSAFAAFINRIGRAKAAQIEHLQLVADDCDILADGLRLVRDLVMLHLPRLRQLDVEVCEVQVCEDESPDYSHPDRSSPFWSNGAFWPMYRALNIFVGDVRSLRRFAYSGQRYFGQVEDGLSLLQGLERRVWYRREVGDEGSCVGEGDDESSSAGEEDGEEGSEGDEVEDSGEKDEIEDLLAITGSIGFL